jgi:hypothetical protein
MSKRTIIITSIVLVVFLLVFLIFWGRKKTIDDRVGESEDAFPFKSGQVEIDSNTSSTGLSGGGGGLLDTGENGVVVPKIRLLSPKETSGYGLFDENGTTTIRFVDTESGNIHETSSKSLNTKRITNTTILQTIDSLWLDIDNLILRYIDEGGDIQTFFAEIKKGGEEGGDLKTLIGSFASKNIEQIDVFDNKAFTILENSSGSTGVVNNSNLESAKVVWNTPLKEIRALWAGVNLVAINTKPSANSNGFLFYLNTESGSLRPAIVDIRGLNTNVSRDHSGVLYNRSEDVGISLWFMDTETGERRELSKKTIVDKCVWLNSSEEKIVYCAIPQNISIRSLPDEWYMGNVSFSDNIWKINLETGEEEVVFDKNTGIGRGIDVIKISLNKTNDYLVFVNKTDMTLWGISLSGD